LTKAKDDGIAAINAAATIDDKIDGTTTVKGITTLKTDTIAAMAAIEKKPTTTSNTGTTNTGTTNTGAQTPEKMDLTTYISTLKNDPNYPNLPRDAKKKIDTIIKKAEKNEDVDERIQKITDKLGTKDTTGLLKDIADLEAEKTTKTDRIAIIDQDLETMKDLPRREKKDLIVERRKLNKEV
jgi:hypothetical protein